MKFMMERKNSMRTDTTTFRSRITAEFRALGLTVAKAKAAASAIIERAEAQGYPDLADSAKAAISFDFTTEQSVYMDDSGVARLHIMPNYRVQPLVTTEPTKEQEALCEELVNMLSDLYEAEGEEKDRLNAIYTEKRDQILAINPYIHGGNVDPDLHEFYHNIFKSEYGFRPRKFLTYKMLKEQVDYLVKLSNSREAA
jgi:hypothetical protein